MTISADKKVDPTFCLVTPSVFIQIEGDFTGNYFWSADFKYFNRKMLFTKDFLTNLLRKNTFFDVY